MRKDKNWFMNQALWTGLGPYLFNEKKIKKGESQIEAILNLVNPKKKTALDLCCGVGRCSIPLARKGFKVTGVDNTPYFLKQAKEAALKAKVNVEFIKDDMRNFRRTNAYGLVVNLFGSFGYFENEEDDIQVLENIYNSLVIDGYIVLDIAGKEIFAQHFNQSTFEMFEGGVTLLRKHKVIDDWDKVENEWIVIKRKKAESYNFTMRLYSGKEIKQILLRVGFKNIVLYGDFDGSEYTTGSNYLIVVARKK